MGAPAVRLRPSTRSDLDWVLAAEGHPENAPYVTQWPRARHAEALDHPDQRHYVLERAADGAPVGYVILAGLAGAPGGIEVRRIVVTKKRRGYGGQALRLIRRMAFDGLKAGRLWLDVRPNNPGARRLYEKEGFVVEGTAPDGLIILAMERGEGA